jgi:alkanesulfonate monooxygenase SsuD/methylene tetrahydromethanopterin reductase-like flavin-dependent oxidoreductase (luciferase family)/hemerythrin-like domain-containing protein
VTDYGHELEFGLFPTPEAAHLGRVLELAQLADVLGLDVVSVQDHPYQAKHLDAWTLLSVLGARTSAIKLAPNVASLPLRPPVVLAKSAATLDLVTGGRVELGLGAGGFWDAIAAAGGPRRTPKQAVDALVEAIAVIRAFWAGGSVSSTGEHYDVKGLHAGPEPAHDIPIWIGAYKPRMIRVTAELADAWVPSMGYVDPPQLPDLNARLDEAAVAAGRAPEQIRRIYNVFGRFGSGSGLLQGSPSDWAEQLAGLSLEHGMSTYILGTDDADTLRRFADEVVPATRELVTAERALPGGDGGPRQARAERSRDEIALRPTADRGERLTGELAWDETARPTLDQAADSAYPPHQQATAQHLVDVHDGLRAELAQVRDVVDQVRKGYLSVGQARSVINTMTIRQNNWTLGAYCESYCRIVTTHHTLEDRTVFPHLRRSEPGLGAVLDRLEEEHEVIADVLDELDRALVALVGDASGGRAGEEALDTLQAKVDLLTDTLLSHLSYEERELLGPLARHGFG